MKLEKVRRELRAFALVFRLNMLELFVENRPRWKDPKEWIHLAVDPFVSAFDILKAAIMPYTFGHIAAVITLVEAVRALV